MFNVGDKVSIVEYSKDAVYTVTSSHYLTDPVSSANMGTRIYGVDKSTAMFPESRLVRYVEPLKKYQFHYEVQAQNAFEAGLKFEEALEHNNVPAVEVK